MTEEQTPLLTVSGLTVRVVGNSNVTLLREVEFTVNRGEVLALVGESGSGKSTACMAVTGLLGSGLEIASGSIRFDDRELVGLGNRALREIRGAEIAHVFQDPTASLNPVRKIGTQLTETRRIHSMGFGASKVGWIESMLEQLGLADVSRVRRGYPSQLSGGMRQRVCIGIGFSADPRLVIADEPTTSLDVSSQGRILHLLVDMKRDRETSVLLVSHDLHVVRSIADRMVVLYGGRVLESGRTSRVMTAPKSQYTASLLRALPKLGPGIRDQALPTIAGRSERTSLDSGCPFAARCESASDVCHERFPDAFGDNDHRAWCWNPPEPNNKSVTLREARR